VLVMSYHPRNAAFVGTVSTCTVVWVAIVISPCCFPNKTSPCRSAIEEVIQQTGKDPATGQLISTRSLYPNLALRDLIQQWTVKHAHLLDPDIVFRVTNDSDCMKDLSMVRRSLSSAHVPDAGLHACSSSPLLAYTTSAATPPAPGLHARVSSSSLVSGVHACGTKPPVNRKLHACSSPPQSVPVSYVPAIGPQAEFCIYRNRLTGTGDCVEENRQRSASREASAAALCRAGTLQCAWSSTGRPSSNDCCNSRPVHAWSQDRHNGVRRRTSSIDGDMSRPRHAWPPHTGRRTPSLDGGIAGNHACHMHSCPLRHAAAAKKVSQGGPSCTDGGATEHGGDWACLPPYTILPAIDQAGPAVFSEPQAHVSELVAAYGGSAKSLSHGNHLKSSDSNAAHRQ
jgi:hypothetical protein